ncbi:MAG TPA: hypothetical protein VMJ10_18565 [Kofleriaceae bacterium]|nr:hypothetical protein [Kofleriaceae bacterium]
MRWVIAIVALTGCRQLLGLDEPSLSGAQDGAVDVAADAPTCTAVSTTCIDDVLQVCTAPNTPAMETTCTWGCLSPGAEAMPHCAQLQPSGGGVTSADLDPDSTLQAVTLTAVMLDGDVGSISGFRTGGAGVVSGIGYAISSSGVAVFRFASLTISGTLTVLGSHPVALVANGTITVSANIDASGSCIGVSAGPGGFDGGEAGLDGSGASAGKGGASNNVFGGGGGGYGGVGGPGGGNTSGTSGGITSGNAQISALVGGSGGGGGGATSSGGGGGGGGGAIQLASNKMVHVDAGINVGGCGGSGPGAGGGGGGGGGGGAILIEAPTIEVSGTLAANGGGGGAGDTNGNNGQNGMLSRSPALGGAALVGAGTGGNGAAGAEASGSAGAMGNHGGGGGGGMGWIRLNTKTGQATVTGQMSPGLTDSSGLATAGVAAVQ